MRNPQVPELASPEMIDSALLEIQIHLLSGLSWLQNAFGKMEVRVKDKKKFPAIFVGGDRDYLSLMPDSHLGNYCFFDIEDGEMINKDKRRMGEFTAKFGLIFWFNYEEVYPSDHGGRTIENVKRDVLKVLGLQSFKNSSLKLEKFYERKENVFKGFSGGNKRFELDDIADNDGRRPFGMLRLSGEIKYFESTKCDFATLSEEMGVNYMEIGRNFVIRG